MLTRLWSRCNPAQKPHLSTDLLGRLPPCIDLPILVHKSDRDPDGGCASVDVAENRHLRRYYECGRDEAERERLHMSTSILYRVVH